MTIKHFNSFINKKYKKDKLKKNSLKDKKQKSPKSIILSLLIPRNFLQKLNQKIKQV